MGTKDVGSEFLPTAAWVRERTDEFARVRMKLARHIALVNKEDSGEKVKVPAASDEKGKTRLKQSKSAKNSKAFELFRYYFLSYANSRMHIRSLLKRYLL